ncbi:MAG TPA: hypothetical protein VG826_10860 [Pirellulales bacterium]|nr:hypothetical protein [Pirellulales bacterium]
MTATVASSSAREALLERFRDTLEINLALNRSLVSYQSNRKRPFYRWFKYKEGFSAALVEYVLGHYGVGAGVLLDPFAGSGAALLVGRQYGLTGRAIELLPLGVAVMRARLAAERVSPRAFSAAVEAFRSGRWEGDADEKHAYGHLAITRGAFPERTEQQINQFRTYLATARLRPPIRLLLETACLSVLETVSFTRKDGQYLRWDKRSPRNLTGRPFHKGPIPGFREAMLQQLEMMRADIAGGGQLADASGNRTDSLEIEQGSCLNILPAVPSRSCKLVVTSPPYCNRYDYTRTYALELAYLGTTEAGLKALRHELLSCTVENKSKVEELRGRYQTIGRGETFGHAQKAFENQQALQEVLSVLDRKGSRGELNNPNVPRMVRNYFLESTVVLFELARIVSPGGRVVMVNDNVQYAGEEVPVDLILCALAEEAGFRTERIWVLERGKGNSSQQMGAHGRNELRKCAYVWKR